MLTLLDFLQRCRFGKMFSTLYKTSLFYHVNKKKEK